MTREDIENNIGYWQEKANLEYIRQRQEHGVNDPYMITEIDEAFDVGFDKGYQYAIEKACEWLTKYLVDYLQFDKQIINDFRKSMEE